LGGNQVLKFVGERGEGIKSELPTLKSAVAVSAPCCLKSSAVALAQPTNQIYMQRFLKTLGLKAQEKHNSFPESFDLKAAMRAKTFYAFDHHFTAALNGFKGADEYYAKSSCQGYIPNIKIPTLLISALDDPFLPNGSGCYPINEAHGNPNFTLELQKHGGHLGFVTKKYLKDPNALRYHEKGALDFVCGLSQGSLF
jgi:uncharacterized protein